MAQHGRVGAHPRMSRQSSMSEAENKAAASLVAAKGLQAQRHGAGTKPLAKGGAGAPAAHRRALSEVGNLVDHAAQNQRMDKENAGLASKAHVATKQAQHKRTSSLQTENPNNGVTHGKAGAEQPKWGSKGLRTTTSVPNLAADVAPTAGAHHQHLLHQQQQAAKLARARSSSTASTAAAGEDVLMVPLAPAHPPAAHAHAPHAPTAAAADLEENCAMSLTSSLTACSEEACGEADMMEAEETLPDIDWDDRGNPNHVTEYVEDIYAFYRKAEKQNLVSSTYMARQTDVNDKMRAILIDWLIEVHLKFKLMPETLYLTVNLIDRYLETTQVTRKNLQLVGVTAMLVASKYEEIWAPEVKDFVYISDNAYDKQQILDTEKHMLNSLRFNLTVPTPYVFAARFMKAAATALSGSPGAGHQAHKATFDTTWYLLELCLPDYAMLKFPPSMLAAAALYTALLRRQQQQDGSSPAAGPAHQGGSAGKGGAPGAPPIGRSASNTSSSSGVSQADGKGPAQVGSVWGRLLERHSGYTEGQLMPCVHAMVALHHKAPTASLKAVHKKYSQARFSEAAKLPPARMPAPSPSLGASVHTAASGAPAAAAAPSTSGSIGAPLVAPIAPSGQPLAASV